MNYVYEYCIGNENVTQSEIQEILEEIMDQEFDTICEDNSVFGKFCEVSGGLFNTFDLDRKVLFLNKHLIKRQFQDEDFIEFSQKSHLYSSNT